MRTSYVDSLDRLKHFLQSKGIRLSSEMNSEDLRKALRFVWRWRLFRNISTRRIDPDIVQLVLRYARGHSIDLHDGYIGKSGWVQVGWKDNPDYQHQLEEFEAEKHSLQRINSQLKLQRESLSQSSLGDIYRYVMSEYARQNYCPGCQGGGYIPSMIGLGDTKCHDCDGTGKDGYIPQVSDTQKNLAEEFKQKMDALQDHGFHGPSPTREMPVYAFVAECYMP